MIPQASSQGDLPALLDTLTVAVTTLDAMGIDGYRDLYLYVVGTAGGEVARDLRVEDEQLTVGPPQSHHAIPLIFDPDLTAVRRALLLSDLRCIMKTWAWSAERMAAYLRCTPAMLSGWIGRPAGIEIPRLPQPIVERIRRLSVVEQVLALQAAPETERPAWLTKTRPCFAGRTAEAVLLEGNEREYAQLLMWALNIGVRSDAVH